MDRAVAWSGQRAAGETALAATLSMVRQILRERRDKGQPGPTEEEVVETAGRMLPRRDPERLAQVLRELGELGRRPG